MLDRFEDIGTDIVRSYGPLRLFLLPLTLVLAAGGLAATFSSWGTAAIVLLVLFFSWTLILLGIAIAWGRRQADKAKAFSAALTNLRKYVNSQRDANCKYALWREEITVKRGGDAHIKSVQRVEMQADSAPLHFLSLDQAGESLTRSEMRAMEFSVRISPGGARAPVQVDWQGPSLANLWIHLEDPLQPGEWVEVTLECDWPHTLPRIYKRGIERINWNTSRQTDRFEYALYLNGLDERTRPKYLVKGLPDNIALRHEGGSWKVEGYAEQLPPESKLTLTLDCG